MNVLQARKCSLPVRVACFACDLNSEFLQYFATWNVRAARTLRATMGLTELLVCSVDDKQTAWLLLLCHLSLHISNVGCHVQQKRPRLQAHSGSEGLCSGGPLRAATG
jgi:hypothetical protein